MLVLRKEGRFSALGLVLSLGPLPEELGLRLPSLSSIKQPEEIGTLGLTCPSQAGADLKGRSEYPCDVDFDRLGIIHMLGAYTRTPAHCLKDPLLDAQIQEDVQQCELFRPKQLRVSNCDASSFRLTCMAKKFLPQAVPQVKKEVFQVLTVGFDIAAQGRQVVARHRMDGL